jgi:hypothetical protein
VQRHCFFEGKGKAGGRKGRGKGSKSTAPSDRFTTPTKPSPAAVENPTPLGSPSDFCPPVGTGPLAPGYPAYALAGSLDKLLENYEGFMSTLTLESAAMNQDGFNNKKYQARRTCAALERYEVQNDKRLMLRARIESSQLSVHPINSISSSNQIRR